MYKSIWMFGEKSYLYVVGLFGGYLTQRLIGFPTFISTCQIQEIQDQVDISGKLSS